MVRRKEDKILNIFGNQYIRLITRSMINVNSQAPNGDIVSQNVPVTLEGVLVDADHIFYFLGPDEHTVASAIRIDEIIHLELADPNESSEELLQFLQNAPERDKMN